MSPVVSKPHSSFSKAKPLLLWSCISFGIWIYLCAAFWGESYDDVFLAYQYARNIENGNGFVFNKGEHFLGTPAPLFVGLLALFHSALSSLTLPQIGTVLSCAGLGVTSYSVFALGYVGGAGALCSAAVALLAVCNPFSLLVIGGESPIYLALCSSALLAIHSKRHVIAGLFLGLALMNRTEALIPLAVISIWILCTTRKIPVRFITSAVCTVLPWIIFAFWEFGSPLTNSFIAKVAQVTSGRKPFPFGFARWFQTAIFGENPWLLTAVIPALVGALTFFRTSSPYLLLVVWCIAQTAAYCCLPIPFYHWYAAHVGVLGAVFVTYGALVFPQRFFTRPPLVGANKQLLVVSKGV